MENAKRILTESGMPLIVADDMDDAARKVVISLVDWCHAGGNCEWDFAAATWLEAQRENLSRKFSNPSQSFSVLKGHCHAIWQLYKKLEGVFASIEFQN